MCATPDPHFDALVLADLMIVVVLDCRLIRSFNTCHGFWGSASDALPATLTPEGWDALIASEVERFDLLGSWWPRTAEQHSTIILRGTSTCR